MTAALLALNARTFASIRRHRNYRLYFTGQVISVTGTWMQNIALGWFVFHLTHSAFQVGLLAFLRFVPFTILALPAGVLADRFDNRRTLMVTQASSMVFAALLAALPLSGWSPLWAVYTLALLGGIAVVVDAPNRHALTMQLVGREELPNAVALNASLFNLARVVGPALGGVLIAAFGPGLCFGLNAASFLAVLVALALMHPAELYAPKREESPKLFRGMRQGLAYVRRTPAIRLVLLMTMVVSTVGFNFNVLIPVLAGKTLHGSAVVFGVLGACFGLGALGGALLSASMARASRKMLLIGSAGFSTALVVLAPIAVVWAAAILLVLIGFFFVAWTSNSQSVLQLTTPDHLRGRVLSIYLFAFGGFAPVGGLLSGWLAEVGGTPLAFTVAGLSCLAVTGYAALRWPREKRESAEAELTVEPEEQLAA